MKFAKHKWVFVAGIIGTACGALISFYITDNVNKRTFEIYIDHTLSWEENEAIKRFNKNFPELAIYAQDRLISYVNRMKEMGSGDEKNLLRIIGFAEGRKALLYENLGEINKSEMSFKKAIEILGNANISITTDELKSLVIHLRQRWKEEQRE